MKAQINNLVNGHFGNAGTNRNDRLEIASTVISENMESMKISLRGYELNLIANWSKSRKSVSYTGELPLVVYNELLGDYNLPRVDPKATIIINGDMTVMVTTNSKKQKLAYNYIKESEIKIL